MIQGARGASVPRFPLGRGLPTQLSDACAFSTEIRLQLLAACSHFPKPMVATAHFDSGSSGAINLPISLMSLNSVASLGFTVLTAQIDSRKAIAAAIIATIQLLYRSTPIATKATKARLRSQAFQAHPSQSAPP